MSAYSDRRRALAAAAAGWRPGDPVPEPLYTDGEHRVWRIIAEALRAEHDRFGCRAFLDAKHDLSLPGDHVPQLGEVSDALAPLTGFRYVPVAGLAPLRTFYGGFADGLFRSTQYLRHPSTPLYTPEPDLVHEVMGHANQLASPNLARLYRLVGGAVARTRSEAAMRFLSHVFWFTMEFGVVWEGSELKAYGAGILSSVGELAAFRSAEIRPADLAAMGNATYDITRFQPVLYAFGSMAEMEDVLSAFFAGFDDAAAAACRGGQPVPVPVAAAQAAASAAFPSSMVS